MLRDTKPASDGLAEEIVIDFREAPEAEAESERAKQWYDQGMMNAQIAQLLGCSRSRVTALLKLWFESRGLKMPDGRVRRATLKGKHVAPGLADLAAMERWGELVSACAGSLRFGAEASVAYRLLWEAGLTGHAWQSEDETPGEGSAVSTSGSACEGDAALPGRSDS